VLVVIGTVCVMRPEKNLPFCSKRSPGGAICVVPGRRSGDPVKILTASEPEINPHGSTLAGLDAPPQVDIFYRDTDAQLLYA
jgi:hypothetical protein